MQHHEIRVWHIYKCPNCNASETSKLKFVVTIAKQKDRIWGFFINTPRSKFILANPHLIKEQVRITPEEYNFLDRESDIGCQEVKDFFAWELTNHIGALKLFTKETILKTVESSDSLSQETINTILNSKNIE